MRTQLQENLCLVILGKAGTGKSLLARAIVANYSLMRARKYYVVVTSKADWSEPLLPREGENLEIDLGRLRFVTVALEKEQVNPKEPPSLKPIITKAKRVIFWDKGLDPQRRQAVLSALGEALLALGNALVVVDEAERYFPRYGSPEPWLDVLRQGRYRGIDIVIITHSDTGVHPEVMQEANAVLSFAIQHPTRIERLRYYYPDPQVLSQLGPYEYLLADDRRPKAILWTSTRDLRELKANHPELFVAT